MIGGQMKKNPNRIWQRLKKGGQLDRLYQKAGVSKEKK